MRLSVTDESFAAGRLRAAVTTLAEENGLSDGATFELKLAATEALSNALRHGAPPVDVTLEARDGAVEVEIADHGTFATRAGRRDGGRGLPLMVALADEVVLDSDERGTRVRLRKLVHPRSPRDSLSA